MRLFIAIDFNELKGEFTELQNKIDISLAMLKPVSTFHLTLKFLGKVSIENAEKVKKKLKNIKFKHFSLTLDKIGVFPSENYIRVIWVGTKDNEDIIKLQEKIELELKEFSFKKDFKFHPHITLARVKSVNNKEEFNKKLKDLRIEEKTIEVNNFKLVKSTLTPKGPVYEDLKEFSAE